MRRAGEGGSFLSPDTRRRHGCSSVIRSTSRMAVRHHTKWRKTMRAFSRTPAIRCYSIEREYKALSARFAGPQFESS